MEMRLCYVSICLLFFGAFLIQSGCGRKFGGGGSKAGGRSSGSHSSHTSGGSSGGYGRSGSSSHGYGTYKGITHGSSNSRGSGGGGGGSTNIFKPKTDSKYQTGSLSYPNYKQNPKPGGTRSSAPPHEPVHTNSKVSNVQSASKFTPSAPPAEPFHTNSKISNVQSGSKFTPSAPPAEPGYSRYPVVRPGTGSGYRNHSIPVLSTPMVRPGTGHRNNTLSTFSRPGSTSTNNSRPIGFVGHNSTNSRFPGGTNRSNHTFSQPSTVPGGIHNIGRTNASTSNSALGFKHPGVYNPSSVQVPVYQSKYQRPLNNQPGSTSFGSGGYPQQQFGPVHPPVNPPGYPGYHPPPSPPGYPSGYPGYHPPPQPAYQSGFPGYHPPGGNVNYGHITVINNSPTNVGYGHGYGYDSRYHGSSDNTLLGLYVGYKIGQLMNHNHYHDHIYHDTVNRNINENRRYEVHHYYHGKEAVPEKATLQSNSITVCKPETKDMCVGDSVPLCMQEGTLLCVSNPKSTVPCKDNSTLNCVNAVVPCLNSTDPSCKNSSTNTTSISMPCISTININGTFNASMLSNNSIVLDTQSVNNQISNNTVFCVTILAAPIPIVNATTNGTNPTTVSPYPVPKANETHIAYALDQGEMWLKKLIYNIWG